MRSSSEFLSASCSPYSTGLPKSKKTNSPTSLSRSSSERTDSMNAFRQLRQSGPLPRNHDNPAGNRIMIYGPKSAGTYIVEFRTDGCPMGLLCRMFREEPLARPCVSQVEPSNSRLKPVTSVPETPPFNSDSGGVLVLANDAPLGTATGRPSQLSN